MIKIKIFSKLGSLSLGFISASNFESNLPLIGPSLFIRTWQLFSDAPQPVRVKAVVITATTAVAVSAAAAVKPLKRRNFVVKLKRGPKE